MEEHEFLIVDWVNRLVGKPIASLLGLQLEPSEPLIPVEVVMATVVLVICFAFFGFLRSRLSVENPGKLQHVMEVVVQFLEQQMEEIVGPQGGKFLSMVGTIGVFILFSNMLGLIPGMAAPTSNINVPAGCALAVFAYYNFQGVRAKGVRHYLGQFMGPVRWLAPLMIPIEVISHLARPFSLTVRLFANIFAEELLIIVFFTFVPFLFPLPFMAYAIFGGLLQAFIFVTLSMVYLGGAVATEEH